MQKSMNILYLTIIFLVFGRGYSSPYDPDTDLPTPKIIRRHGYKAESHEVITEDGYILTMHRIPNNPLKTQSYQKHPILLQHGVLGSSAGWVINGLNRSLAYIMADQNYDIWLGNARGNMYSKGHVSHSPSDTAFWDFSWHEMGYYDLPAMIDYILNVTNQKSIFYVGHSMGTTMSYVLCSSRPEYNSKIKMIFSLAPIAFLSRAKSPLRYVAPYAKNIELVSKWFGAGEFLPKNTFMHYLLKFSCLNTLFETKLCENYIFIICGHDPEQFNMKLLPAILGHSPAGTSTKTLVHFAQEIQSGKFCQFDYGEEGNLKIYGLKKPPEYQLSNIMAPTSLYFADNDLLADTKDVELLHQTLPNSFGMFRVNFSLFNHLDFLWSIDVFDLLFKKVQCQILNNSFEKGKASSAKRSTTIIQENSFKRLKGNENKFHENIVTKTDPSFMKNMFTTIKGKIEGIKESIPNIKEMLSKRMNNLKSYVDKKLLT